MKILISPYSRPLRNGNKNAKNYPFWPEVIVKLQKLDIHTIQIAQKGEELLKTEVELDLSYKDIQKLMLSCDTWCSVDNFLGHLGYMLNKQGVVIFGKSDPDLFGHPNNTNLLKDRKYLRSDQWRWWEDVQYEENVFVNADTVVKSVLEIVNKLCQVSLPQQFLLS